MHPQVSETVFVDGIQFSLLDALVPLIPGDMFISRTNTHGTRPHSGVWVIRDDVLMLIDFAVAEIDDVTQSQAQSRTCIHLPHRARWYTGELILNAPTFAAFAAGPQPDPTRLTMALTVAGGIVTGRKYANTRRTTMYASIPTT